MPKSHDMFFREEFSKLERNLADYLEIGRLYFEEEKGLKFLESIVRYLYKSTNIEVYKVISATKTISERGGEVTMTTAFIFVSTYHFYRYFVPTGCFSAGPSLQLKSAKGILPDK